MAQKFRKALLWSGGALAAALIASLAFVALFDWNWLRAPAEKFVSDLSRRDVSISKLDVKLRRNLQIVLSDVTISNAPWSKVQPAMGRAQRMEISLAPLSIFGSGPVVVPHVLLVRADASLERNAKGERNWTFRDADQDGRKGREVQFRRLTLLDSRAHYLDRQNDIRAFAHVRRVSDRDADKRYPLRFDVKGTWRGAPFGGRAETGDVLSVLSTGEPFPLRLDLKVGATRIEAEGEIDELARLGEIDVRLDIAGPSLASLYPTLRLSLPETPPYRFTGRLTKRGARYAYEKFSGKIGASDIAGDGNFEDREPRPQLEATLRSQRLDVADLGTLVGVERKNAKSRATAKRAPRRAAEAKPTAKATSDVLPDADFSTERLGAIDARVVLKAQQLVMPRRFAVEDFAVTAQLRDGVLRLAPLRFGYAGGDVVGEVTLDASAPQPTAKAAIDLRRVLLADLFPTIEKMKASGGLLGAQIRLKGNGSSIADLLGSSSGTVTAAMAGGQISHLSLSTVSLNGGEVLRLLLGGDKPTAVRCAGAALQVTGGKGTFTQFVFDTEEVRINGSGTVDLGRERFDVTLRPRPKDPGLFSVRAPVRVFGSFSDADYEVDRRALVRGGAAAALAVVNPLAALLPLIETGQGKDADCGEVLTRVEGAVEQAESKSNRPPKKAER